MLSESRPKPSAPFITTYQAEIRLRRTPYGSYVFGVKLVMGFEQPPQTTDISPPPETSMFFGKS